MIKIYIPNQINDVGENITKPGFLRRMLSSLWATIWGPCPAKSCSLWLDPRWWTRPYWRLRKHLQPLNLKKEKTEHAVYHSFGNYFYQNIRCRGITKCVCNLQSYGAQPIRWRAISYTKILSLSTRSGKTKLLISKYIIIEKLAFL